MPNIDITGEPIDETTNHEWTVEIDTGNGLIAADDVVRARFVNKKRDQAFIMAKSPDSSPANSFSSVRRVGGGGAVNVLYAISPENELWIGGVMQRRANISDEQTFNLVRGYNRPNEANLTAAVRELLEETGRDDLMVPTPLEGKTVNVDSAMNDSRNGGGVDFYRIPVPFEALVRENADTLVFDKQGLTEEQLKEGIYKVLFVPGDVIDITSLADGFTIIGFVRLLAYLDYEDEEFVQLLAYLDYKDEEED